MSMVKGRIDAGKLALTKKLKVVDYLTFETASGSPMYLWVSSVPAIRYGSVEPTTSTYDSAGAAISAATGAAAALSNLSSVAINTSLISDTDSTDDLGSTSKEWRDLWIDRIAYIDDARLDIAQLGGATNYIDVAAGGVMTMAGSSTIDGVATGNLVDKSAAEVITGGWDVTTADLDIKQDSRKVTFGLAGSTDSYIEFDGTDMLFYDSHVAGTVTLSQLQSGTVLNPVVSGNLAISDGTFAWTDSTDETAGTFSFANTGAGADIDITSAATTGEVVKITADAMANGTGVLVDCAGGVGASGSYFRGYDGTNDDIVIGEDGEITIKGAASDMITVTAGNILATAGNITATLGNIVATAGNVELTLGNVALTDGNITNAEGKIEIDSTADEISYIKRNNATGTGPVFEVEETNAAGGVALLVDSDHTGAADAMQITYDGTDSGLNITHTDVAGTALTCVGPASQTASLAVLDGATGSWIGADGIGMLQFTGDGTLAHANASTALINYTGTTASGALGSNLRIVDGGTSGGGTSYSVYIDAGTNMEALKIDSGTVVVDETIKATAGVITVNSEDDVTDPPSQAQMDAAFGAGAAANDGLIGIINDAGAGTNTWLCVNTNGAWYYAAKLTIGA